MSRQRHNRITEGRCSILQRSCSGQYPSFHAGHWSRRGPTLDPRVDADDAEDEGLLVGGERGCGFAPPLIGGVEGSILARATSSPYRNYRKRLTEKRGGAPTSGSLKWNQRQFE